MVAIPVILGLFVAFVALIAVVRCIALLTEDDIESPSVQRESRGDDSSTWHKIQLGLPDAICKEIDDRIARSRRETQEDDLNEPLV